jgi:hypothetical protein
MKFLNNYLYITDKSLQELEEFNECRIEFKYGKGSSDKNFVNNRTERRLNLNKPHHGYEDTYFCENQKIYTDLEEYTKQKLRENNNFKCIKTNSITKKDSEFFWIIEKVLNKDELVKQWFNLKKIILEIHLNFYSNKEDVEKVLSIIENKEIMEELKEEESVEEEKKIIDDTNYDKKTMSLKKSKIHLCKINNEIMINKWGPLLTKIFQDYKEQYNIQNYSMIVTLSKEQLKNVKNNTFKHLYENKYYRGVDAPRAYDIIKKLQQECNINLELKIQLA